MPRPVRLQYSLVLNCCATSERPGRPPSGRQVLLQPRREGPVLPGARAVLQLQSGRRRQCWGIACRWNRGEERQLDGQCGARAAEEPAGGAGEPRNDEDGDLGFVPWGANMLCSASVPSTKSCSSRLMCGLPSARGDWYGPERSISNAVQLTHCWWQLCCKCCSRKRKVVAPTVATGSAAKLS